MKIYIAGPITGLDRLLSQEKFSEIEAELKLNGHEPINPWKIPKPDKPNWFQCMKADLKELLDCDGIYLLKGWHLSEGANLEYHIAKRLGLNIKFEQ